jgi:Rap guanine nucleotide exchange factor 1
MSTAPPRQSLPRKDYDDVPPPLPTKKSARSATVAVGALAPPPLPLRVDSIPGFRSKLEHGFHAPPPPSKPPRSDGDMNPHQPPGTGQPNLLYMIDHYNKTIQHPARGNDEQAPPIPPKRRTVMIYNQLIQASNYTFDESTIPSLNIPDMVAPPPIPAKKRNKKPLQPVTDSRESVQLTNGSPHHSISSSNSQDLSGDAEEKVNYLEIDDASPYLSFEQEETGWTLKGGEIDALIAYAASSKRAVKQFTEAFLSTYYTFITPDELIFKLLLRLHNFYKVNNVTVWQTTTSLLLRVLTNLNAPLIKEAEITLIELIHTMLKDGNLKFGQLIRNALVEKLHQKVPEFIPLSIAMCKNSGPSGHITDFDPSDVAKQLTILDADYFYKVDVSEMLYWAKEHNEEKCPRLTLFTMHFNNVSQWVKSRLLDKDVDWKKREKLMNYFISVMKSLREHGNFNAYLAILSAIESASVSRLDWSERIIKSLEEPRALIDCRGSFKNYRQAFSQTKPPCIPYM